MQLSLLREDHTKLWLHLGYPLLPRYRSERSVLREDEPAEILDVSPLASTHRVDGSGVTPPPWSLFFQNLSPVHWLNRVRIAWNLSNYESKGHRTEWVFLHPEESPTAWPKAISRSGSRLESMETSMMGKGKGCSGNMCMNGTNTPWSRPRSLFLIIFTGIFACSRRSLMRLATEHDPCDSHVT